MEDSADKIDKAVRRYFQSEKGKQSLKRYQLSGKGKQAQDNYQKSEKGLQSQLRYYLSEKGVATRKRRSALRKLLTQAAKYFEENPDKSISDFIQFLKEAE